jgi:hypothetical protein
VRQRVTRWLLCKNHPTCSPTHFLSKSMDNFYRGKSSPNICALSVIFTKLPDLPIVNFPIGENFFQSGHPIVQHDGQVISNICHEYMALRSIYTKHNYCVARPNLCRPQQIHGSLSFCVIRNKFGRTAQKSCFV